MLGRLFTWTHGITTLTAALRIFAAEKVWTSTFVSYDHVAKAAESQGGAIRPKILERFRRAR